MRFETLEVRVREGFSTAEAQEYGPKYLDALVGHLRDLTTATRRATLLVVLTAIAFVVLADAKTTVISLGPFKVDDPGPLIALLPAVTAHLLYELIDYVLATLRYTALTREVVKHLHPTLEEHDLELGLVPATVTVLYRSAYRSLHAKKSRVSKVAENLDAAATFGILLGAVAFLCYAVYTLLGDDPGLAEWASSAFILFTALRGGILLADEWHDV